MLQSDVLMLRSIYKIIRGDQNPHNIYKESKDVLCWLKKKKKKVGQRVLHKGHHTVEGQL